MKRALASSSSFRLPVVLVLGFPSAITIPLTEQFAGPTELTLHTLVSLATLGLVVSLASLFRFLVNLSWYRWWITPVLSFVLGASRGLASWFFSDALGLVQQPLVVRVLTSGFAWAALLPIGGYFFYLLQESRKENGLLRSELASAEEVYDSLEQQRAWLTQARISGLERELAAKFVDLAKRLNESGLGPKSLREVAAELRVLSRSQVRPKSIELYRQRTSAKDLLGEYLHTSLNANFVALAYFVSSSLNNFRVYGVNETFPAQTVATGVIWFTVTVASRLPVLNQFVWLPALLGTGATLWLLGAPEQIVATQAIGAAIWSQALTVAFLLGSLILERQQRAKKEMERVLKTTEVDIQALTLELESQNIELAKYLHAILQTRLMSYAMQLEKGEISDEQRMELVKLLTNPMREFQIPEQDLIAALDRLAEQWQPLVTIKVSPGAVSLKQHDLATSQVVREAVANSVRHGLADLVTVEIRDSATRQIVVTDNGIGPRIGPSGLGTEVFNGLCSKWELVRSAAGGAEFRAEFS